MWTNDPVADAERAAEDERPVVETCDLCGKPIHSGNGTHYGDDYYAFNDCIVCEDCLSDYTDGFKVIG